MNIELIISLIAIFVILWAIAFLLQDIKNEARYHNSFMRQNLKIIQNKLDKRTKED